jgi:hypothetical protein
VLLGAITAVGVLVLVAWPAPTLLVLALVVLVTAVVLATVVALARLAPAPAAAPTGDPGPAA